MKGDITRSVDSSGEVEPTTAVEVSSQLSGRVLAVDADFNDIVKRGQTLAVIDPSTFQSQLNRLEAEAQSAGAQIAQERAGLNAAYANYRLRSLNLERAKTLKNSGFISSAVLDQATFDCDSARASVAAAEAGMKAAQARLSQANAAVEEARLNLLRTRILAPADGIVIDRKVEPGQTVAASLQAPTLFVLASDLSRMRALLHVDEADIAEVRPGQVVQFTADAMPDHHFEGRVLLVRMQGERDQGAVNFTVIADVTNAEHFLRPGMTVSGQIIVAQARGVLKVPASALRFHPEAAHEPSPAAGGAGMRMLGRAPTDPKALQALLTSLTSGRRVSDYGQIWVQREGEIRRVAVRIGASDDRDVEVRPQQPLDPKLDKVIIGERT